VTVKKAVFVPALIAVVVGITTMASDGGVRAQDSSLTIRAGDGETGFSINQFLPNVVTVEEGTTVTWQFPWFEIHNVAFGEPAGPPETPSGTSFPNEAGFINGPIIAGAPGAPGSYSVVFPEAGSYDYLCIIHPQMTGTVNVVEAGQPGVDSQLSADAVGDAQYQSSILNIKEIASGLEAAGASVTSAGGKSTYTLKVGANDIFGDDAQLFFPSSVRVKEGDTVRWVANAPTPHDVVVNPPDLSGPPPPGFEDFDPFETTGFGDGTVSGPGDLEISPIMASIPGLHGPNQVLEFSLKFAKEGTYQYLCLLHADQGMVAQVVVEKRPVAPRPPNTGTGASGGSGELNGWFFIAGVLVLALGTAGATVFAARR
jgi:plastocyanin